MNPRHKTIKRLYKSSKIWFPNQKKWNFQRNNYGFWTLKFNENDACGIKIPPKRISRKKKKEISKLGSYLGPVYKELIKDVNKIDRWSYLYWGEKNDPQVEPTWKLFKYMWNKRGGKISLTQTFGTIRWNIIVKIERFNK